MKKKQVLIVFTGAMDLGGIERSLLGLLDSFNYSEYDVDLFLYGHHGPLYNDINPNVNVLPEVKELAYLRDSLPSKLRNGCYYSVFLRIVDQFFSFFRPINNDRTWAKVIKRCVPALEKEYDLAIGFFRPFDFLYSKVQSRIKVGWVHTDYSAFPMQELSFIEKDYERLDKIVAVSESCKDSFISAFPALKEKIVVIENILLPEYIKKEARLLDVSSEIGETGTINLLSVGRFCYAKNFDSIPEICLRLIERDVKVKWYLIGYGPDKDLINRRIKDYAMEDNVIMLGKKDNPYPYMAYCDVYIQPSRYEGKCVAVREAQILGKPVIITDYPTASSQIKNGIDGVIVPTDNKQCADGIAEVLKNKKLLSDIIYNLNSLDYSSENEIKKIEALVQV